jgi:hypothetical protein
MKKLKPIPKFKNIQEEAKFWDTHDTTDYLNRAKVVKIVYKPKKNKIQSK